MAVSPQVLQNNKKYEFCRPWVPRSLDENKGQCGDVELLRDLEETIIGECAIFRLRGEMYAAGAFSRRRIGDNYMKFVIT
jgi:hypothetical protein